MKVMSVIEMENVSGAGIIDMLNGTQSFIPGVIDTVLGTIFSTVSHAAYGSVIGGYYAGSSGGGMLGVGVPMTFIGWGAGLILGGIVGAIKGVYEGVRAADRATEEMFKAFSSGSWVA